MPKHEHDATVTPHSGKFGWGAIKSPKQHESPDGVNKKTGETLPAGANKSN